MTLCEGNVKVSHQCVYVIVSAGCNSEGYLYVQECREMQIDMTVLKVSDTS